MADKTPPDPFAMWRDWMTQSEQQWNSFLNEAMATEQFSQSMGRMMDVYLNMQKSMNDVMGRYFSALNLPTRTDVLSINDRLSEIEAKLNAIHAEVGRAQRAQREESGAWSDGPDKAPARPPRTRKPATKA